MQNINFFSYPFSAKNGYRYTIPITTLACLFFLFLIEHTVKEDVHFHFMLLHKAPCYLEVIPVMLLTSLSGYAMGGLAVFLFFGIECVVSHHLVYHAFVLLLAALISTIPVTRGWYRSIKSTLITWLMFSVVIGNGWEFLFTILEGKHFFFGSEVINLVKGLGPCGIVCLCCYCYENFCPKDIRELFFVSFFEMEEVKRTRGIIKSRKGSGINAKITKLIVFEATMLLIPCFGFAISLLDNFHAISDWEKIVFSTRLVILMTIIAAPSIMVTMGIASMGVTNPLILMAQAAEDSYICKVGDPCRKDGKTPLVDLKRLQIKAKDEIGVLYDALVRAFENTNAYIANLEHEKQLETELAAAKASTKAKSDFLSNMSHEIRTPINAVLGLDEMILRETTEPEIRKYAVDIENAGKSLLSIVNDILDFSKIEAGKMEIIPVNYGLASMVNDLINMSSKRAKDKNLRLNVDVDKSIPNLLFGDDVRIKQCILNILTNAIKYTKEGSVTMSISGKKDGDDYILMTVHVVDTGIGIKKEDIPKLDSAFQRIEEERNRTIEGTGLGINIVKNLLSLMNSRLEVQSEYGKGSDFYFTVRQRVVDWEPVGDFNEMYEKSLSEIADYKECFHAPSAKILVVDDTELNLTVVKGLLKQTEIQIDTAKSGQETLELVTKKQYDVIFLDHRMPGMDGIETLHVMKELATNLNKDVPCIALTANAVAGAKEMYLEEGFTDYLTKPIESVKLEKMLIKFLPKDKVEKCIVSQDSAEVLSPECAEAKERFKDVTGIYLPDALKYTGDADILEQTLCEFYDDIDSKSASIENFAAQKDFRNFTVLVHALKSSARLIGAKELSEKALYLEQCGDKKDEAEISAKTPGLLELYRSYKEHLSPLCKKDEDDSAKEEIPLEQYESALKSIKECAEAFDFDTADQIMEMLGEWRIPSGKKEQYSALKRAVQSVDREQMLSVIG